MSKKCINLGLRQPVMKSFYFIFQEVINMAFCTKCGAQIDDGVKVCPACGAELEEKKAEDLTAELNDLNNTADITATLDPQDIEQNKVMGVLAYLSWLVLIPLFAAKESPFARFHVNQGLVLAIAEIAWAIVFMVLTTILTAILPVLGIILALIQWIGNIIFFVFSILGIINAAKGLAKELPIIGNFRILK